MSTKGKKRNRKNLKCKRAPVHVTTENRKSLFNENEFEFEFEILSEKSLSEDDKRG